MKKLFTLIIAIAFVGSVFVSCDKDDDETPVTNSVTITGTFTVGDKTYTSPTFDLGSPEDHVGYVNEPVTKDTKYVSPIVICSKEDSISLDGNYSLDYRLRISSTQVGAAEGSARIRVYDKDYNEKYISCSECTFQITAIGEVGEYIEGTYEGTFSIPELLKDTESFPVTGKFKVKRVEAPEYN